MAALEVENPGLDLDYINRMWEAIEKRFEEDEEDGVPQRKTIVIINGKGGVGKSSLAAAIAVALASIGKKVLLVEMDPQGNNAEDLGFIGSETYDDGKAQAEALLSGGALKPLAGVRQNLWVIPGGELLEEVVEELYCQRRAANRAKKAGDTSIDEDAWKFAYAAAIEPLRDDFDVILLDVAPGSSVLQLEALVAGDAAIVPSKSDPSSRKGLRMVARRFLEAQPLNPYLVLLGVVLFATNTSATRVQKEIREDLEADLGGAAPVFGTSIRHVEAAAVACRKAGKVPAELRDDDNVDRQLLPSIKALASDYQSLAMEVLQALMRLAETTGKAQ